MGEDLLQQAAEVNLPSQEEKKMARVCLEVAVALPLFLSRK